MDTRCFTPEDEKSPLTPLFQRGNYKELLVKSPFEKGGFRGNAVHLMRQKVMESLYPVMLSEDEAP